MAKNWDTEEGQDEQGNAVPESAGAKIEELIHRAEPLIEQVNNLYAMFTSGVERLPPHEKRKQLEQLMATLQSMAKPNTTYSFRVSTLNTRYVTMRDRWDKLVRDVESGKIKRTAGPKR
jgi:hypothetical protein